jgi:hypothetical protein
VITVDQVVNRLEVLGFRPRRDGEHGWRSRCPFHPASGEDLTIPSGPEVGLECKMKCHGVRILDELGFARVKPQATPPAPGSAVKPAPRERIEAPTARDNETTTSEKIPPPGADPASQTKARASGVKGPALRSSGRSPLTVSPVERVLSALEARGLKPRKSGAGWSVKCPAHEDSRASLSIGEGSDSCALVKCHAGCATADVLAALGLEEKDLFVPKEERRHPRSEIVAVYPYRDESGAVLYEAVRFDPKDFRQRRPDPKARGGYSWNLGGVRRVLYRLPETLEAVKAGRTLYLVEGEKDVLALVGLGLDATTTAGGAESWRPVFAEPLAGADVVLVPDRDKAGAGYADDAARSLHGKALRLRLVALPAEVNGQPVKDVSDFLAAGGTREELLALVGAAPGWGAAPPTPQVRLPEAQTSAESAAGDGPGLLSRLVAFFRKYVVLTPPQGTVLSLWTLHTHLIEIAETTPYVNVKSAEVESGKTRTLETAELLVATPWRTDRVSAAALVRKIDSEAPTLLLDETDAAFNGDQEYAEALRGVLNGGYRRGGKASLCVGQGTKIEVRDFSVFGPKMIAGLRELPGTVASRSITIELKRRKASESVARFRERNVKAEAEPLRSEIEKWAAANLSALRGAGPPAEIPGLRDRMADAVEPLLSIADRIGGEWREKARAHLGELCGAAAEENQSHGVTLLRDVRAIFGEKKLSRLSSSDLCSALAGIETSPWPEWSKGKPITPRGLARLLGPLRIAPRNIREGDDVSKGYVMEDFLDAWERFLPSSPPLPPCLSATTLQPAPVLAETRSGSLFETPPVAHRKSEETPIGTALVAHVADRNPEKREPGDDEEEEGDQTLVRRILP